ncbi:MAG: hypothetical protein KBC43_13135 [Bacteroidales bacterium]|nr:hypothetical protein [Bacteroidales bacterium]
MDLQTRKLNFIQEFLRLNNEKLISKLENLLKSEKAKSYEQLISPLSEEELNRIIDEAEKDSKDGRLISAVELKKEIDSWS